MISIGNDVSSNSTFDQSINDVFEGDVDQTNLPIRRRLTPVSGGRSHTKLSQLFHPASIREQHLEQLLTPPTMEDESTSPDSFRRLLDAATNSLRHRRESGGNVIKRSLAVLDRLSEDRQSIEKEMNRLLNV